MRKSYGNTWWGKQWLNALNHIDYSNRLPRGKTYANKGLAYDIEIDKNTISAKVKGSSRTPYKVKFTIPQFSNSDKEKIIDIITSNPLYLSKLLNRELPHLLDSACEKNGIYIFPHSWNDLKGNCSCPDWAVPCKHMAAVLFLIANEIDKNPFIILQLKGFNLFESLQKNGYSIEQGKEIKICSIHDIWQEYSFREGNIKWDEEYFNSLDFSKIPNSKENILTILTEKPNFYPSKDFKILLKKVYTSVAKEIQKEKKKEQEEISSHELELIEDIEIIISSDFDLIHISFRNHQSKLILEFNTINNFIQWISKIPLHQSQKYSSALRGLLLMYFFSKKIAEQSAFIPQLIQTIEEQYNIRWIPALFNEDVDNLFKKIIEFIPDNLLFYKKNKEIFEPTKEDYYISLCSIFLNYFVHQSHNLSFAEQEDEISSLFFNGNKEAFHHFENKEYPFSIQLWLNRFFIKNKNHVPVIQVEDDSGFFEIKIKVQNIKKELEGLIPLSEVLSLKKYTKIRLDILRDLSLLSDYFPQINTIVSSQGKESLFFDSKNFVNVLFKILPVIQLFGIKILLPKALQKLLRPQLSMSLDSSDSGVVKKTSVISMDNMLNFKWKVALGNQTLSQEEFLKTVKKYSGIVKINDAYVYFDEQQIQKLITQLENPPKLNEYQLFQAALTEEYEGASIEISKSLRKKINQLLEIKNIQIPKDLKATLRPYQQRGFEWLYKNSTLGFGSIIADDMGLGKTLQVITTLLKFKEEEKLKDKKAIIVVPTTLLTNWDKEIKKFANVLQAYIYHGSNRKLPDFNDIDILLTTYGVARSDVKILQKYKWYVLVIDEAQNIKNSSTAQTKAIKNLKANIKIAMSGTPVENRLSEYWSIFDFSNKGYLNSLNDFKKNYARPIEVDRDIQKMERFKKVTSPFILRRLKSDKTIIKDLPEKIEKDQFCELTKEQAAVYQNVIDTTMKTIEQSDGIQRRGLILKLITALKQICNHPSHFLKKGDVASTLSGKSILLINLLQQILDNGEKTLIFTQYQEMGQLLIQMIQKEFNIEVPFLHGGVSRKNRDIMVEDFQKNRATKILILSLKAGGTGLNLTEANNIIHYDLWWNPAVEAQATDRAYRIGQKKNVMVHRFITKGTFEEKINQLIKSKKELANLTVNTGEKWVGDFSNEELKDLVELG